MRKVVPIPVVAIWVLLAQFGEGQQSSPNVLAILRAAYAAQAGQQIIQDSRLTGNVEYIAGSDDETVPISLEGISSGSGRTDISLSAGTLTEMRQVLPSATTGVWLANGGPPHSIAEHNMMTDAAWFFPLFVVQRLLTDPNAIVSDLGTENGTIHIQAVEASFGNLTPTAATQVQHLSEIDLYLDASSYVPVGLGFNIHPDSNAFLDIPVYVQFSNYHQTTGASVAMRIQKYLNGTLAMDIRVQTVALNIGLTQTDFATQ